MNLLHTTYYKLYKEKVNKDFKLMIGSDIHFSIAVKNNKLNRIINQVKKINPNYFLIPGDLIDSVNEIEKEEQIERLINFLKELSKYTKVLISLGNHDYSKKNINYDNKKIKHYNWEYYYPKELFNKIKTIPNIYLLDNKEYKDDKIYVVGLTLPYEYFYKQDKKDNVYYRSKEDKEVLITYLKEKYKLITNISNDRINIAMIHSPIYLKDIEVVTELKEFDYLLSGHMHEGCVVPILYELWNSDMGIIAPGKKFFPHNTRNTLKKTNDKLVVTGAITTFHRCSGFMQVFNILFPSYLTVLDFTNNKEYENKVEIQKKYSIAKKN